MSSPHAFNKSFDVGKSTVSGPYKPMAGGTAPKTGSGFSGGDWATVISGLAQGAANASGPGDSGAAKKMSKEQKRRTIANLLGHALNRKHGLKKSDTEHKNSEKEFKADALQSTARGFVNAFKKK